MQCYIMLCRVVSFGCRCRDDPTFHSWDLANKPRCEGDYSCSVTSCYVMLFSLFIAAGMTQPFTPGTSQTSRAAEIRLHETLCYNMPCSATSCFVMLFPLFIAAGMTQPFTLGTLQTSLVARVMAHAAALRHGSTQQRHMSRAWTAGTL
jgi:hypothetical protein